MVRRLINPILFLPLSFYFIAQKAIVGETKSYIDEVLEEKENKIYIDHKEIKKIISNNNQELK